MNEATITLLIAILGVPVGLITYFCTKLWLEPYFEYKKLKAKINADLFYFANAIEIDITDKESILYKRYLDRCETFRKYAANLLALYPQLPLWYKIHDFESDEHQNKAIKSMLVYANSDDAFLVRAAAQEISGLLKLPTITF